MLKPLLSLCLAILLLTGCTGRDVADRQIAVSIEPLRYVTEAIAGNKFHVVTLMPQGASPETYEPSPRVMIDLGESEFLFRCGTLGFEQTRLPKMAESNPALQMVNLGEGIEPIRDEHHHHHDEKTENTDENGDFNHHDEEEESIDPHIWMSAKNLSVMACNVATTLCRADSANADYYRERLAAFEQKMDSLDLRLEKQLSPMKTRIFLIFHPALGYFARRYGMTQLSVEHDGKESSVARIAELTRQCQQRGVRVCFISKENQGKMARRIAEESGIRVVDINPLDYDVAAQLSLIATSLTGYANK